MFEQVIALFYKHIGKVIMSLISLFTFPYIILYLFLIYMSYNGFFSYDFFVTGTFGMSLFFYTSMLVFLFLSIFSCGSFISLVGIWWSKKNKDINLMPRSFKASLLDKKMISLLIFINFVVIASLTLIGISVGTIFWAFFIVLVSSAICIHIGILIFYNFKHQLISYFFIATLIFYTGMIFPEFVSNFISIGLRACNVGGNINASVVFNDNRLDQHLDGNLLLLTPQYVFLKHSGEVSMIPINNIKLYTKVEKKAK